MSKGVVLDASAVLAVLQKERGAEKAADRVYGATISAVNYGEVLKKSAERGGAIPLVKAILAQQRLDIVSFDEEHATKAAEIWEACKPFGLSFGDRACVALGLLKEATVITAEHRMSKTPLPVEVELIRSMRD